MPKNSTSVYLSSLQSPKLPFFQKELINCWGLHKKCCFAGYVPSAHAKRLFAILLASLIANAQELISLFLLARCF